MLEDQAARLDRLLDLIDRVRPHALLISGDVFDRPLPPEGAIALFDRFLNETAKIRSLPVFLIPGNHDSCERLGFASGLLRESRVTIFSKVEDAFHPVEVEGDNGAKALVYGIPFVEPFDIGRALGRDEIDTPDAAIGSLCQAIRERRKDQLPSILLCHALVAGGETSESEREIFIGGTSAVDVKAFDGFSYTALGHLHKPQRAGHDRVRYSGSLLPYSKSEVAHRKTVTEIELATDGGIELKEHEMPLLRNLRYIEGELDSLIEAASCGGVKESATKDDYIIVGLTDIGAIVDAFHRLHKYYPRLLHVSRVALASGPEIPLLEKFAEKENQSELEIFAEFFTAATGTPLEEAEREAVINAIAEIEREERLI